MLLELRDNDSLQQALDICQNHLDLILFAASIRGEVCNSFPESPIRLFCYPTLESPHYFFMVKNNLHIRQYCFLAHVSGTSFDATLYMELLKDFKAAAFGTSYADNPHKVYGKDNLVQLYTSLIGKLTTTLQPSNYPHYLFYMTEQQLESLKDIEAVAPTGYEFYELDVDKDAEIVNRTWKHAKEGDDDQTRCKLKRMPSAAIRSSSGKLVAHVMVDPAGFMNHHFVSEVHRREGLGTAIEIKVAQRCVSRGIQPYKMVETGNTLALNLSTNSPFWTMWRDEKEGEPVVVMQQEWNWVKWTD